MKNILDVAINKAKQSPSKYKISAIGLDHRGKLLGSAFNSPRFGRYGGGLHAEMRLLHRYGTNVKTVIVCRVGLSGDILPIDSCPRCKKVLDKLGIKVLSIRP